MGLGGAGFPWATLMVNVAGSLLLGVLMRALPEWGASLEVRALLTVGFCGSFTTFSTFGYDAFMLFQNGTPSLAALYVAGSVLLGLVGVILGVWIGAALS